MLRTTLIALAAVAFGCRGMRPASVPSDDSTLAVLGKDDIACGAVAIAQNLAVTASHCVPETIVNYLAAPDGPTRGTRPGRGIVVVRDPSNDLALFATTHLVPAELRFDPPELDGVSSMVAHVPKPWGVVAIHPSELEDGFVRTERLRVGASGSGLWDGKWRLVGVAVGNDHRSGYFAGVALIRELVRHVPRDSTGRIQTASAPKVCGIDGRELMRHPEHPDAVNVRGVLDKAGEKNHRIDIGLSSVGEQVEAEQP